MENKHVGFLVIGIAVLLIIIIFLFQTALKEVVASTCTAVEHSVSCPMTDGVNQQTYLSLGIVGLLMVLGFILIFSKPQEKIIFRRRGFLPLQFLFFYFNPSVSFRFFRTCRRTRSTCRATAFLNPFLLRPLAAALRKAACAIARTFPLSAQPFLHRIPL